MCGCGQEPLSKRTGPFARPWGTRRHTHSCPQCNSKIHLNTDHILNPAPPPATPLRPGPGDPDSGKEGWLLSLSLSHASGTISEAILITPPGRRAFLPTFCQGPTRQGSSGTGLGSHSDGAWLGLGQCLAPEFLFFMLNSRPSAGQERQWGDAEQRAPLKGTAC